MEDRKGKRRVHRFTGGPENPQQLRFDREILPRRQHAPTMPVKLRRETLRIGVT